MRSLYSNLIGIDIGKSEFERLIKKGKKPLIALVAIMRKIVVIANARIKQEFFGFNKHIC